MGSTSMCGMLRQRLAKPSFTSAPSMISAFTSRACEGRLDRLGLGSVESGLSTTISSAALHLGRKRIFRPRARIFLFSAGSRSRTRGPRALPPPMKMRAARTVTGATAALLVAQLLAGAGDFARASWPGACRGAFRAASGRRGAECRRAARGRTWHRDSSTAPAACLASRVVTSSFHDFSRLTSRFAAGFTGQRLLDSAARLRSIRPAA